MAINESSLNMIIDYSNDKVVGPFSLKKKNQKNHL